MLSRLAAAAGQRHRLAYRDTADIFGEIRRAVPIYSEVSVGSAAPDGIWPANQVSLPAGDRSLGCTALTPIATLTLDVLNARFDTWFQGKMTPARAARS